MTDLTPAIHQAPENSTTDSKLPALLNFWRQWRAWIIGPILVGIAGILLTLGCDYASFLNRQILEQCPRASLALLPTGFALFVYLVRRFFRGAQGSGMAQTVAAVNDPDPQKKGLLLSIRIAIGKGFLLMAGFFVGGSIGREGPAVQIGASIMHAFYGRGTEMTVERRRNLIIAGGAAGIAVAFNTPLAGIMFGIEELSKRFAFKEHTKSALAVFIAVITAIALVGDRPYFAATNAFVNGLSDVPVIVICGLVGGVMGGLFSRLMVKMAFAPPRFISGVVWNRPMLFAAFCGLGVALLGLLTDNLVFGSGYEQTLFTLDGGSHRFAWYYGPAKFVSTFLCGISGIPAGMFAPSISIGAGLGDTLSYFYPSLAPHGVIIILLMAAYLTGVTRTPLTALIITMEMTVGFHLLLPLFAAVLIANGVSKLIAPVPMYTALAEKFSGN